MGRRDIITKEYMEDTEVFADVFNHMIYKGEKVIDPKNLKELDTANVIIPYGADGAEVPYQKYRDVFKILCAMEDENAVYLLLGVENQLCKYLHNWFSTPRSRYTAFSSSIAHRILNTSRYF